MLDKNPSDHCFPPESVALVSGIFGRRGTQLSLGILQQKSTCVCNGYTEVTAQPDLHPVAHTPS